VLPAPNAMTATLRFHLKLRRAPALERCRALCFFFSSASFLLALRAVSLIVQLSHTSILFCALLFYKKTGFLSTLIFYVTIKNNHKKGGAV